MGSKPSHNIKPGRRRGTSLRNNSRTTPVILFFLFLLTLLGRAQALAPGAPLGLGRFRVDLAPRQDVLSTSDGVATTTEKSTKTSTKTKTTTKSTTTSGSDSSSSSASASATTGSAAQLTGVPRVFDTAIGVANFSNKACPQFLTGLSDNDSFKKCLPFSLLLDTSSAFGDASENSMSQVLDDTCNASNSTCNDVMQGLALQLKSDNVCATDFTKGNPSVQQAYYGFLAYAPMYQAGCLKASGQSAASTSASSQPTQGLSSNSSSNSSASSEPDYCYVASTASGDKTPINAWIYGLPLGTPIPDGTANCNDCLRQTMNIFAKAATNATSPLSTLYAPAAQQINSQCGKNWVAPSITVDKSTQPSAASNVRPSGIWFALVVATLVMFGLW